MSAGTGPAPQAPWPPDKEPWATQRAGARLSGEARPDEARPNDARLGKAGVGENSGGGGPEPASARGDGEAAATEVRAGAAAGPEPAGAPAPEADLGSLLVEVEHQRDGYLEALRRLQAEFDNYRKRVERLQRDVADNAAAALLKQLLPALDTADLALAHGAGEDVKQVASALFDILSKEGLERIDPEDQPFDPEQHDAIAHEPAEDGGAGEPLVSEVLRAGYHWKGRVLRPAMVKVRG